MEFVDKALARRLEAAEEIPQIHYAAAYQRQRPAIGAEAREICGGHMVFAGLGSPIGRAVGMGLDQPFTAADLDIVEDFYRVHSAPAQLDVCPLHDVELLELCKTRGYAMAELNNVLWRPMRWRVEDAVQVPDGTEIRPGRPEEAEQFAAIVAASFHEFGDPPEGFHAMLTPLFQFPGVLPFVASVNGMMAGVGAALLIPEHRIVALFGAGTLPQFRRKGIQTALLQVRLQAARATGCDIAVIVTRGGTTSQRNAERLGFRLAYSKATLIKQWGRKDRHRRNWDATCSHVAGCIPAVWPARERI